MPRAKCPCGCGKPRFTVPRGARYDAGKADRFVAFAAGYLHHTKGRFAGQPFVLEPWQEWHVARPMFGILDKASGFRWYNEALILMPRKNGKSEIAAAINLYLLLADGEASPEVYSLAADKKQAGLVFKTGAAMVRADPVLRSACKVFRNVIEAPECNGIWQVMSSDADLQHGLNPSGASVDEFHVHPNADQYDAMASGSGARQQPLLVVISTVGDKEAGPLWDMEQRAIAKTSRRLLYVRFGAKANARADNPATWRAANPASWITDDYLADQFRRLPLPVFERLHLNRWPSAGGRRPGLWPKRVWASCSGRPQFDPDRRVIVAVDGSLRRDQTAIVAVQIDQESVVHAFEWIFDPDPDMDAVNFELVEQQLRDLCTEWDVDRILVDPFGMFRTMQVLAAEGLPIEEFPQTHPRMSQASMVLHELVTAGLLRHGDAPGMSEGAATAVALENAYGWRIGRSKVGPRTNVDALQALAMAAQIAVQDTFTNRGGPTVLWADRAG